MMNTAAMILTDEEIEAVHAMCEAMAATVMDGTAIESDTTITTPYKGRNTCMYCGTTIGDDAMVCNDINCQDEFWGSEDDYDEDDAMAWHEDNYDDYSEE